MKVKYAVWWMNPTYLFLIVMSIIIAGAYYIPADSYVSFYRVNKFIDRSNIWLSIMPAIFFVAGSLIASLTTKGVRNSPVFLDTLIRRDRFMRGVIYTLFGFTLFGYIVWFLIMLKNGFTVGLFLDVLKGEPGAIYSITENFEKVTGVTSFTNFGIPFTILACYYQSYKRRKTFLGMLAIVFVLTLIRSVFFSERLAILEVLVPAMIVVISVRLKTGRRVPLVKFYPLFAIVALVGFFGISEYFRSWLSYYVNIYPSFWEFMVTRFFGYYVTAMNTGTLYIHELGFQSLPFPYFSWEWIWKFPGVSGDAYSSMFGVAPEAGIGNVLETMGNPEFNNPSGILLPYHDYGLIGAWVFWAIVGYLSGLLYAHFKHNHTYGLLLYPIWIVGILECPRYLYFSSGRFFPCWIILLLFTLLLHYNRKKLRSWKTAGVGQG